MIILPFTYTTETAENPDPPIQKTYTTDEYITLFAEKYAVSEGLARRIIKCESNFDENARNYNAKVGVDIGYFQLNSYYWEGHMRKLGWNIYNPVQNLEAGFWLLSKQGSQPWVWSKHCWDK